jgi:hypothetical protein
LKNGSDVQVPVLYEVVRTLRFVNGAAVTLPLKLCSDEASAKEAMTEASQAFEQRKAHVAQVLAEFGITGAAFGVLSVQAPESRILRPVPGLLVPRA